MIVMFLSLIFNLISYISLCPLSLPLSSQLFCPDLNLSTSISRVSLSLFLSLSHTLFLSPSLSSPSLSLFLTLTLSLKHSRHLLHVLSLPFYHCLSFYLFTFVCLSDSLSPFNYLLLISLSFHLESFYLVFYLFLFSFSFSLSLSFSFSTFFPPSHSKAPTFFSYLFF